MRRPASDDTPTYAIEAAASAHFNGRHLGAASGLFVALLVAMSLVEAPLSHSQGYPRVAVHELTTRPGSAPAHGRADVPVAQIGAAASGASLAGDPACVPWRAPDRLT